ncbi:MAG: NIL domain-containing protein [Planctomycetes bacterium]|nr:NIL domain-containing protein [Planctomycetota bacterium]
MTSRKFFCTFPQELISEPLISHTLGVKFDVVPNIRAATISESQAHVVVEIEGEAGRIEESVVYLKDRGVAVKELAEGEDPPRV